MKWLSFGLFLAGLVSFSFPITETLAATQLPVPELETLENGLEVVWFINDRLPMVDLTLSVRSGFRDDPAGKSGTAELVSTLLSRGAGGMTAQELSQAIENLGGTRYSSMEDDTFTLGMHGLASDAPQYLDLLAKTALQPDFADADVKREHSRLLDRWNHIEDYSETLVSLAYQHLITSNSCYGRGSLSSVAEFKKVNRQDVLEFHKKHFTPKNSVLVITGRVDKPSFRERILSSLGRWKGEQPQHPCTRYSDPRLAVNPPTLLVVNRPQLTQAQVRIGFRAPLLQAPQHYALVVANALLGEYFNSRLNTLIRDRMGLTYSIHSSFSYSREFAYFSIVSATRNETVGKLLTKTIEVLKDLKKGPIPSEEVETAKSYLSGGFPLSTSTLSAVSARWLAGYLFGLGPRYLNEYVPKVNAVTLNEVQAAFQKDFDLKNLVIVVAGDAKAIRQSLEQSGFQSIKQVSASDLK